MKRSTKKIEFTVDPTYPDISERVRQVRLNQELIQADFAEMVGLTLSHVKQIETGRNIPSYALIRKLHKRFKIKYEWLIDGQGEMKYRETT